MFEIFISGKIQKAIPEMRLGCIRAAVKVLPSSVDLLNYIDEFCSNIKDQTQIDDVSKIEVISDTKNAYRKLGKDPSRYRPSAEALTRRVVKGKGLYRVNNIVDTLNVISIKHGFSIGGYDMGRITGNVELGVGHHEEPYEAIGRGHLNIENLPILRDQKDAFGSPTSDSLRTMINDKTSDFLMVFFDFYSSDNLQNALRDTEILYRDFCDVKVIETKIY